MMYYINKRSVLYLTYLLVFSQTKKPSSKRQQTVWRLECELGVISDPECPIDGGWTPWSPWSSCLGACDNIGHRRRLRECNNPAPSKDGLPCSGNSEQVESCYITNCTLDDYRKLIAGDPARMESLRQLEAVPALLERCLQMQCPYEAIEAALAIDNTWQLNPEALWNSLQCVKHNMGCPVVGEWGAWGSWSACGARCGRGVRWRLRRCDTPPPSDFHLICSGTPLQDDECEGDQCAINKIDNGGAWSQWGQWSSCSESCGSGVRRRRRTCIEMNTPQPFGSWVTHCRGQHDQLEVCKSKKCTLDGRWSGWSDWGSCSQTCGPGRRSRTRSCTRPVPYGGGTPCVGSRVEVGSCNLIPCEVHSHIVALLNGESVLQYDFPSKHFVLFHFYVRFMAVSPHGTLVRRGAAHSPIVRLSLQKWHVCLDASGGSPSCSLPRICSHASIEAAMWHTALITITTEAATLRMDDAHVPVRSAFLCTPELPDKKINILVGERFYGEIQELILNFIPLNMIIDRDAMKTKSVFIPTFVSNIAYERASMEEAYLNLDNDQYLRLPCFSSQDEWQLKLTIKSKRESGTILFLHDAMTNNWLQMALQSMRLKLKSSLGDYRSESSSSTECLPDEWLDITLSKKQQANTVEASVNAGERLHLILVEDIVRKRREESKEKRSTNYVHPESVTLCTDEFYVGGLPNDIKNRIPEELTPFSGVIASIIMNNVLLNLHEYSVERYKDNNVQVSSRTASVSGSYHETAWGKSNRLNLTCLHARTTRSLHSAHWLYLDTTVDGALKEKTVRSEDDGRVLRLVASADNDLRGFYTCRAHTNKRTRNIVTYGVLGKIQYKLNGPDTTTALAVITTITLVIVTIGWLIIEGINDLRNGYGFFRDAHMSPEKEAEAVCKNIDQNQHLISSKSLAKVAKARARRKGRNLASRSNFAAQEPQGLMQVESIAVDKESAVSESESLPALPETKSLGETTHDAYRCEPSYVSSPRHGSITSPRTKLSSSSSIEMISPKILCSRLLVAKHTSRGSLTKKKHTHNTKMTRSNLLTIKSSMHINESPVYKVLQKFQQLKTDDI